jgi:amino acid adenylation domain-containing protein
MNSAKNITAVYPVTPTQKGMLFYLINADKNDLNYREQLNFLIPASTSSDNLKQAWQTIIARHPALRSVYSWENKSKPLQAILTETTLQWREHDLRAQPSEMADEFISAQQLVSRTASLQLTKKPSVSFDYFVVNEQYNVLTFNFTHLQLDGWSMAIISNEVELVLSQLEQHQNVVLPPAGEYKEYIKWLMAQDQEKSINYWAEQLKDIAASKPLKLNHRIDRNKVPKGQKNSNYKLAFSAVQQQQVTDYCRQNGITLNAFMLAALGLLNNQISHRNNSIIGSVVAGRPSTINNVEQIAGFFSNALPISVATNKNDHFTDWLKTFQKKLVGSWEHSYIALEQIKQSLAISITDDLFSTLFIFQNFPKRLVDVNQTEQSYEPMSKLTGEEQSHYPLTLYVMAGEQLTVYANFDTNIYSTEEISQLLEHYQQLMMNCINQKEQTVASILPITGPQQEHLITRGKGGNIDWPTSSLTEAIDTIAMHQDTVNALTFQRKTWNYGTLNAHINGVANELRQQGIGRGCRVALILSRSFEFIVTSFAVLKVGAAYVPIDPKMPAKRQEFICQDSNIQLVISEQECTFHKHKCTVDKLATLTAKHAQTADVDNNAEAYIIYTSGSTGTPKGVSISRAALLNHTYSAITEYSITAQDTGLQFSSVSFDTAVEEIYPILLQAGHLILRDDNIMASSDEFIHLVQQHQITVLNFPTAFWTNWVSLLVQQDKALPDCVRLLIIGGEEALASTLNQWQTYCSQHQLSIQCYNTYGPTEATVVTTRVELSVWENTSARLPIGNAIHNAGCYIVNDNFQVLPDGYIGEIAITGQGLATYYINNPELTEQCFISTQAIGRAYLTGDLGYYSQGNIYYLGRKDHQLKIRGYRVELGEIEQAMTQHEQISECIVTTYIDDHDNQQLIGYYSAKSALPQQKIRQGLLAQLPDYMVPQAFVFMASIPRTLTGKYDRKNLPAPTISPVNLENLSDSYESTLAVIWSKLLATNEITSHSNFFHLGGHSILTIKLIGEIAKAFSVDLIFNEVFNNASLCEMATIIKQRAQGESTTHAKLPALLHQENLTSSPLSFQQERVWFLQQLHKENTAYNFQMTFILEGELNVQFLTETLQEIVQRQQLWYCTFHSENGVPFQKVEQPFSIDLSPVEMSHLKGEAQDAEVKVLLNQLSQAAFDITQLPLIRWKLIKLSPTKHCLLQVEHHLIHDGWSCGLFIKELQKIYEAKMNNEPHNLPTLEYTYNDFCIWQRKALSGDYYQAMENYWLKKLHNIPSSIGLPYDYPRPQSPTFQGDSMMFNLDSDLYQELRAFGKDNGYTLYMTMLAAYYVLLFKYSGQEDINIGAGTASRTIPELHPIMGMMVNSIVLRTDLSGEPSFLELLARVRETCLDGYTYQDMPFEKLVQKLSPERMGHANPLFQTMFSFHDAEVPELDFANFKVKGQVNTNKSAKLDLNVIVAPHAEQRVGKKSNSKVAAVMTWEYSTDLFTAKTMEEMVDNFLDILQQIIRHPDKKITELNIVRAEARDKLLTPGLEAAQQANQYPYSVPQVFDQQVAHNALTIAVNNADGSTVNYQQLQQRSLQFAHHLIKSGAVKGDVIGLALHKGADLYAMMIAIMRLDCSYVPIDLNAGDIRLSTMLNNLIQQAKKPILVVDVEQELPAVISQVVIDDIPNNTNPMTFDYSASASAAYVLYTSGSTGLPKGTLISQKGILRLVDKPNYISLSTEDIWLQHSSIYFDASVLEIWAALLNGGQIVVPNIEKLTMQQLASTIEQHQITHIWLTAGLFHQYVDYRKANSNSSLKYLLAGGDVLSPEKVRTFLKNQPNCSLINGYGPTENTTFSYCKVMTKATLSEWEKSASVPIGSAITGTRGYVLNAEGQLSPQGAIGELYLAGDGLAIGYLDTEQTLAAFTTKKFVTDNVEFTERLYKTGDMVRYNQHNELEFIGRKDNQIKLRGFRVELTEIEAVLIKHPRISQVCVLVKEDAQANKHLIACYQASTDLASELQEFCQSQLLAHQIPALFVPLTDFPLTANGKLDRKAILENQTFDFKDTKNSYLAPENELETLLCEIWQQSLHVKTVGTHDNFFSLGGHSLIAVNILAQISDNFSVDISLADMFKAPSIKGLVSLITAPQVVSKNAENKPNIAEALAEDLSDDELDALLATMDGGE